MTSIRHSDTPALERRRERVVNELRLIDAELERRRGTAEELHSAMRRVTVNLTVVAESQADGVFLSQWIAKSVAAWAAQEKVVNGTWESGERCQPVAGQINVTIDATWKSETSA